MQSDEDTFLPTADDRLKAQIKELQVRLATSKERQKKLRRMLVEEDLSYVVVSKLTEEIKDPTRTQTHQLEGLQKEIFDELLITAEQCTMREIISYHRLGGRTVFNYGKEHFGIRLETFYNKTYKTPFYLMFLKTNVNKVDRHSLPLYIPLHLFEKRYLPDNLQAFLRVVHNHVQAYITRKEMIQEIENLYPLNPIQVLYKNGSITKVEVELSQVQFRDLKITILFENFTSSFPTQIILNNIPDDELTEEMENLKRNLMNENMAEALSRLWI